eukprot:SAG31_NODE_9298_length_1302_cov_1.457190_2_plen_102_part_01
MPAKVRDVFDAWCIFDGTRQTRWLPWQAGRVKETVHRQFARVAAQGPSAFNLMRGHTDTINAPSNPWLVRIRQLPSARVTRILSLFATPSKTVASGVELSRL